MRPLVLAYHLIMTAYGFWLPNDERGSWSDFVRAWELFLSGGPATRTNERRSLAREPHDIRKRLKMKKHLVRPAVEFNGLQALTIGKGFASYCRRSGLIIYACSIFPKHVHLVVARHTCSIEQVARLLKGAATTALYEAGLLPFQNERYADRRCPSPWTRKEWSVFLDYLRDIIRACAYTSGNAQREGKPRQHWSFVTPHVS
jgi:REP element-mobilizing transposase RayT